MNFAAILSSVILIIGCFLPWLQIGILIKNNGIDNPDGQIALLVGVVALGVSAYKETTKSTSNGNIYLVFGVIGILILFLDYGELQSRAHTLSQGVNSLNNTLGGNFQSSPSDFLGMGLYIVGLGSLGLLLAGFGVFSNRSEQSVTLSNTTSAPSLNFATITAPRYANLEQEDVPVVTKTPEELENEAYQKRLIFLHGCIQKQQKRFMGGLVTDEIKSTLNSLATNPLEAKHLLKSYSLLFNKDLISDLIRINSSNLAISENLSFFIDHGVIEKNHPYSRISN